MNKAQESRTSRLGSHPESLVPRQERRSGDHPEFLDQIEQVYSQAWRLAKEPNLKTV
jgi:hypothetical protein